MKDGDFGANYPPVIIEKLMCSYDINFSMIPKKKKFCIELRVFAVLEATNILLPLHCAQNIIFLLC